MNESTNPPTLDRSVPRTNPFAAASLALALIGIVIAPVALLLVVLLSAAARGNVPPSVAVFGPPALALACFFTAIVCGHLAKARIRRDSLVPGRGLAIAGLVVGYASLALFAVVVAGAVAIAPRFKEAMRQAASARGRNPMGMYDPRLVPGAAPFALAGTDLADAPISLEQYQGKVVLIDFWAMWCGPCIGELPNVVAAYNKYHDQGFEIIGVSLDRPNEKEKLAKFAVDRKMPWPQIYDGKYWSAENAKLYGVRAIPFTVLVGRDGKIAAVSARGAALAPAIEAALKHEATTDPMPALESKLMKE